MPDWTRRAGTSTRWPAAGISLDEVTHQLELDGVSSFSDSFDSLLGTIRERLGQIGERGAA